MLTLEEKQMKAGSIIPVLLLRYGKYGRLVTNVCISNLWEGIWKEGVQLCMRTPQILQTQREHEILLMKLITTTVKLTQDELR